MGELTPPTASRRTRGRPANLDRRNSLVAIALRSFADHGYDGTSMSRVAQAAGITEGALYRYFPRKTALRDAVVDYALTRMARLCEEIAMLARRPTGVKGFAVDAARAYAVSLCELYAWYAIRTSAVALDLAQAGHAYAAERRLYEVIAAGLRDRTIGDCAPAYAQMLLGAVMLAVLDHMCAPADESSRRALEASIDEVAACLVPQGQAA